MKSGAKKNTIYMDNASATPVDLRVAKAMEEVNRVHFANPSGLHKMSVEAKKVLENARRDIAKELFAHADEIIFTSSGSESNSLAIEGVIKSVNGRLPHIVTSTIEHPSVLETCRMLEREKRAEVTYVMPDARGIILPASVKEALRDNTVLVSIMYANNEIGTVQPIRDIAKVVRQVRKIGKQIIFHSDACQAMNYLETANMDALGVDLLTFNGAKIYGPKGMGVLYKKRAVNLLPVINGGGQEFGMRSGTENVAGAVGMALALKLTNKIKEKENKRLKILQEKFFTGIKEVEKNTGYKIEVNGDLENRLPNNINITVEGISNELLVIELDAKGIAVSSKSACKSAEEESSHVIHSLRSASDSKFSEESIRFSLGRETKSGDISKVFKALTEILNKYKRWK
jgi:cysteine desulfurase